MGKTPDGRVKERCIHRRVQFSFISVSFSCDHVFRSRSQPFHLRSSPCVERETRPRVRQGAGNPSPSFRLRLAGNRCEFILIHPSQRTWQWGLTVDPPDRAPRSQSARCSEACSLISEPVAASEQVANGDPFSNCSICPLRVRYRRVADHSIDSRLSVLA